jgi:hypothetical protein
LLIETILIIIVVFITLTLPLKIKAIAAQRDVPVKSVAQPAGNLHLA